MNLLRRFRKWLLGRHSKHHREQMKKRYREYESLTEAEKADHYWRGRGL